MNVLFINTGYVVTFEESVRLDNIQLQISGWQADLRREWDNRKFTKGERYLSKLNFHNGIRHEWKVYLGFKEDNLKKICN